MSDLFLKILNMSITASWLVPVVLLLRMLLKKAPRWTHVLLWGMVAVRLICPFSVESTLSLIPSAETIPSNVELDITPAIDSGVPIINQTINPLIQNSNTPAVGASINPLQITFGILANLWMLGMVAMTLYTAISYLRLRHSIGTAVLLRDNIYQSENVSSPFVLGIFRPRIYLPYRLSETDREHVIAHETAHIRRRDHYWKPLGFLLLTIHWFNPLMWLAYILLCRDIESACDERVIRDLGHDGRADYSQALLNCSIHRRSIAACPLAFGEVGVKDRVKSVLNYKKPAFWIILLAVIACIATAVFFLTDPASSLDADLQVFIDCRIAEHHQSDKTAGHASVLDWKLLGQKRKGDETTLYMWVLYEEYSCEDGILKQESGAHSPTAITVTKADGGYRLVEYWTPRDGSYYDDDIRAKVPWYLYGRAIDSQRYIDEQKAACERLAREYFADALASDPLLTPPIQDMQSKQEELETELALKKLRAKYPVFFDIPTENGLSIYIWQMAETSYRFSLYRPDTQISLLERTTLSVSLEDMRLIVSTYDIDPADIRLIPIPCVYSSYHCAFDDAYYEKVENMFAEDGFTVVRHIPDSATPITFMNTTRVEREVQDYVLQLATDYIEEYNRSGHSPGSTVSDRYYITEAEVREIHIVAAGVTSGELANSVHLYRAELALRPNRTDYILPSQTKEMQDGYFVVYTPYFAMYQGPESDEVLIPIGQIAQDTIAQKYGTKEMLQKYGDKYKAAVMEMRNEYLSSLGEDKNADVPETVLSNQYSFAIQDAIYDLSEMEISPSNLRTVASIGPDHLLLTNSFGWYESAYIFINETTQTLEKILIGAAIDWHSEDITTFIYNYASDIFAYDGSLIAHIEMDTDESIRALTYSKDGTEITVRIESEDTIRTVTIPRY